MTDILSKLFATNAIVVFLHQRYHFDCNTRICHNLARSEDHLLSNASLAFPPYTWTAGFQRSFFV